MSKKDGEEVFALAAEEPVVDAAVAAAEELSVEALLGLAAEKLERRRGIRAKTAGLMAAEVRALAERVGKL